MPLSSGNATNVVRESNHFKLSAAMQAPPDDFKENRWISCFSPHHFRCMLPLMELFSPNLARGLLQSPSKAIGVPHAARYPCSSSSCLASLQAACTSFLLCKPLKKRVIAFDSKCPRKLAFLFSPPLKHPSQRTAPSSVAAAADPLAEEDKRTVSVRNVPSAASSCIHINKF